MHYVELRILSYALLLRLCNFCTLQNVVDSCNSSGSIIDMTGDNCTSLVQATTIRRPISCNYTVITSPYQQVYFQFVNIYFANDIFISITQHNHVFNYDKIVFRLSNTSRTNNLYMDPSLPINLQVILGGNTSYDDWKLDIYQQNYYFPKNIVLLPAEVGLLVDTNTIYPSSATTFVCPNVSNCAPAMFSFNLPINKFPPNTSLYETFLNDFYIYSSDDYQGTLADYVGRESNPISSVFARCTNITIVHYPYGSRDILFNIILIISATPPCFQNTSLQQKYILSTEQSEILLPRVIPTLDIGSVYLNGTEEALYYMISGPEYNPYSTLYITDIQVDNEVSCPEKWLSHKAGDVGLRNNVFHIFVEGEKLLADGGFYLFVDDAKRFTCAEEFAYFAEGRSMVFLSDNYLSAKNELQRDSVQYCIEEGKRGRYAIELLSTPLETGTVQVETCSASYNLTEKTVLLTEQCVTISYKTLDENNYGVYVSIQASTCYRPLVFGLAECCSLGFHILFLLCVLSS